MTDRDAMARRRHAVTRFRNWFANRLPRLLGSAIANIFSIVPCALLREHSRATYHISRRTGRRPGEFDFYTKVACPDCQLRAYIWYFATASTPETLNLLQQRALDDAKDQVRHKIWWHHV